MRSERYSRLQLSIFSGAFVFGIVMSSLGSLLPSLFSAVQFEKGDAGGLFLAMNFAMLGSSLLFGPVCDRFGFRAVLVYSTLLVGGAFALLSVASSYGIILLSLTLLGFGGGALNGGTNALLSDISPARRQSALNLLGIFFGFGAFLTPFLIGSLLEWLGLTKILLLLVILTLAPFGLFLSARFPRPKHQGGFSRLELRTVLQNPLLFLFGILLFFQSGNEFTMGGWISTYLAERHGFQPRSAAYGLAGYWAAIMLGRLAVSRVGSRISASRVVLASAILALLATVGLILTGSAVAPVFIALVGLGFAAIFPTTLAQVGSVFADFSGTAFSAIFVMALSGGITAPWLVGQLAQDHGVGAGFWATACSCTAIILLQATIRIYLPRRRSGDTSGLSAKKLSRSTIG